MKTKFTIFSLLLILVIMLIWQLRQNRHVQTPVTSLSETNSPLIKAASSNSVPAIAVVRTSRLSPEEFEARVAEKEKHRKVMEEKSSNEWRTPIEFYGRVVDESNNPVSGAKVDFDCNDISETGTSYYHTQSDINGSFSLKGITGKLLGVYANKEGYYSYDPHGQNFYYAGQNQNFVPDAGNPVVFRLRKKGEGADLIKVDYPGFAHIAQLKHDGTPVELDLLQGTQVSAGTGQLKLEFWRDLSDKNAKIFDWKLRISVSGGGLIDTDEEFPFKAPETGYQPSVVMDMQTNNPSWQGQLKTKYYIQIPDGKYGRMEFEFLPYNGVFTIHSAINPSGSRNLESK